MKLVIAGQELELDVLAGKKPTMGGKSHHMRMKKYHAKEMEHHDKKIAYCKNCIKQYPQNKVANGDYEKMIVKHSAFKNYHEKQCNMHSGKCK